MVSSGWWPRSLALANGSNRRSSCLRLLPVGYALHLAVIASKVHMCANITYILKTSKTKM